MTSQKVINAPRTGAQINDLRCKSLICEESENRVFHFSWSKKPRMDFLRPYHRAPSGVPESMAGSIQSSARPVIDS